MKWRAIGLMSGTSCDGVDAVVVDFREAGGGLHAREVAGHTLPYPPQVRDMLLAGPSGPDALATLHFRLGELFARAARKALERAGAAGRGVDFVGSHGHTVHHAPRGRPPSTLQIGSGAVIAARTGLTTVTDFRPADVAVGGEGAPLTPLANRLLLASPGRVRAIQNVGGIANVTLLRGRKILAAFDTGPGNMVIDAVVRQASAGRAGYDRNGRMASRGRAHAKLLRESLDHPFFRRRPPRSTGREEFGAEFADRFVERALDLGLSPEDRVATATELTAASIADAYRRFVFPRARPAEVIVCGGGARNPELLARLAGRLPGATVRPLDRHGLSPEFLEAVSFAAFALETLRGRPVDLRAVTGAFRKTVLGAIYPGDNARRLRRKLNRARTP